MPGNVHDPKVVEVAKSIYVVVDKNVVHANVDADDAKKMSINLNVIRLNSNAKDNVVLRACKKIDDHIPKD